MAGLYDGHILEQPPIRVDCFTSPPGTGRYIPSLNPDKSLGPPTKAPNAQWYLLTHVHTDHLSGLTDDFTGVIICTPDTKRLLLRLEYEKDRSNKAKGITEKPRRKYPGLAARSFGVGSPNERRVDRIQCIGYGETRKLDLGYENGKPVHVKITAFDANHCAGSASFFIEGDDFAVLHTGDIRCDASWLRNLLANPHPALAPYMHDPGPSAFHGRNNLCSKRLDRIYLDTSAFVGTGDMPLKPDVIRELIELMQWYPQDTTFFFNIWTIGWEEIVKQVSLAFGKPICVDRYKWSLFTAMHSDPKLVSCCTLDPTATPFHACDRYARCIVCGSRSNLVVNVDMVEVKTADWEITRRDFMNQLGEAACGEGPWPTRIECPIARHSPLPELQDLVKVFNPRSLSPNTLQAVLDGLDYYLLPDLFAHCLSNDAAERLTKERDLWFQGNKIPTMANLVLLMPLSSIERVPGGVDSAISRNRRSHAADHASRLLPTPLIPNATLANLPPAMVDAKRDALKANWFGGALEMAGVVRGGYDEGYDTDEDQESGRWQRRRRRSRGEEIKPISLTQDVEWTKIDRTEMIGTVTQGGYDGECIQVESPMSSTPTASTQSPRSTCQTSPFLRGVKEPDQSNTRICIDKEHLRRIIAAPCPDAE